MEGADMKPTPEVKNSHQQEDFNLSVLVLKFFWQKKGTNVLLGKCNLLVAKTLITGEPVILGHETILLSPDVPIISVFQQATGASINSMDYNEWFLEAFKNSEIYDYDLRFDDILSFNIKNRYQLNLLLKKFKQGKYAEQRKERFWNYLSEYFIEELPQYVYMTLKDDSVNELKSYSLAWVKNNLLDYWEAFTFDNDSSSEFPVDDPQILEAIHLLAMFNLVLEYGKKVKINDGLLDLESEKQKNRIHQQVILEAIRLEGPG